MSRFGSFITGIVVGGAAVFGGLKYHVLRTDSGVEVVPKLSATFSETYLDVRQFDASDWTEHRQVAAAVVRAGKQHLFQNAAGESLRDTVDKLLGELEPPRSEEG